MEKHITYKKVASYEAEYGDIKKVLLLYSGGLDTSVILKWLQDVYKVKVITLTLDIGQQKDDLEAVKQKALTFGAVKAFVHDAKDDFADMILAKGIKANACYQGDYHLSTPMGRVITSKVAVDYALANGVDAIAHGCTGKGNDQVRFDGYITTLAPKLKVIAPIREWHMSRDEEIAYAKENKIPVTAKKDFPYSVDDNMWGMTWEGGEIEDFTKVPPVEKFLTTYTLPQKSLLGEELITLDFQKGIPTKINGVAYKLSKLIQKLNEMGGAHGVGITHVIEDRLVGLKSRGVYEQPGAHLIISAHKALEQAVCTRYLNETKSSLDTKWAYMCYGALWHDPLMDAIHALQDKVNEKVTGVVTLSLYKGTVNVVALDSPYTLHSASFNVGEGYNYNVNASAGFIEVHTLQMRMAKQRG